jgi:hypothetical protein
VCDEESEDDIHVFSTCSSARASWQVAGLLSVLTFEVCQQRSAAYRVFALCRIEDYNIVGRVATLFWNIWHNRNDKLWNDNVKLPSIVGRVTFDTWREWFDVHKLQHGGDFFAISSIPIRWKKLRNDGLECNVM